MIELAALDVRDQAAVAQDDDAVSEFHHLIEPVGDEDDPGAAVCSLTHGKEQLLDLIAMQGHRGLVQH